MTDLLAATSSPAAAPPTEPPSLPAFQPRRRRYLRLGCLALVVALTVVLAWISLKAVRIGLATRAVLADLRSLQAFDLQALSGADPADSALGLSANLAQLQGRFASLEANLGAIQSEARPFLGVADRLNWLPRVGDEIQAAPALLQLGSAVATAGRASTEGALAVLAAVEEVDAASGTASPRSQPEASAEGDTLSRLTLALQQSAPQWTAARQALQTAAAVRAQESLRESETLDPRLAQALARLDETLPLLQAATGLASLAPALLGAEGPRRYLLLAQNSDELRATGGFISGVGLLAVDHGQITHLDFQDSYAIYNPNVDHPPAPPDLERTMQAQMLLLRDANWSPDFPATAAVAQSLYLLDAGQPTDGVIAFDLEAVARLIAGLQPLTLPGYAEPVTAQNLVTALRTVWEAPHEASGTIAEKATSDWWRRRKDFMGDLAAAALAKLESGQVEFGQLAWALQSSLQEKHLLVSLNDRSGATLLAEAGWDGALRPSEGDYLMVVDSNVGWNKVNPLIKRATFYQISPRGDGSAQTTLELVYRHEGELTQEPCVHTARYGDSYEDMLRRCYFDYVRIYSPAGAQLSAAEGFEPDSLQTLRGEHGMTIFSGLLELPPGQERRLRLTYELPPSQGGAAGSATYRLRVQKQPGTPAWPLHVTLMDAAGVWRPVSAGGEVSAEGVRYALPLAEDIDLEMERVP